MAWGAKAPWELAKKSGAVTKADVATVQSQVTTVKAKFPVDSPDLKDGAVITAKVADNAVTAPKAATGVVDGDTITGAVVQTATSGQRLVLDGATNSLAGYSGVANEVLPSTLAPTAFGGPTVEVKTGTTTTLTEQALLRLYSGAAGGSTAVISVGNINFSSSVATQLKGASATILLDSTGIVLTGSLQGSGNAHVGYRGTAANQTLTNNTATTVTLAGTASHDIGSGYSKTSDIVTVTNAGVYEFNANVYINTATTTVRHYIQIETWTGSDPGVGLATKIAFAEMLSSTAHFSGLSATSHAPMAAGQKVRLIAFQNQGSSNTTLGSLYPHQLNIRRIS